MLNNKKLGNNFESAFCEILFENGFWVHNLAQNQSGQPADVIAVRNGKPYLIDCKMCTGTSFALSRMEPNQDLSMELWKDCGNGEGWFAVQFDVGECYMLSHKTLKSLKRTSLSEMEVCEHGIRLETWIRGRR